VLPCRKLSILPATSSTNTARESIGPLAPSTTSTRLRPAASARMCTSLLPYRTRSCGDPNLSACGKPLDRPFRFKDLPGELRNRIYEGLMPGEDGVKTSASASNLAHADDECLLAPGFRKLCLTVVVLTASCAWSMIVSP
jgi:hypothetical protein